MTQSAAKKTTMALAMLLAGMVHSQDIPSTLGLKAGLNLGGLTGKDAALKDTEAENRLGANLGLFVEIGLHPIFSLQPEVQYTQKGETVKGSTSDLEGTWRFRLDYVEFPLLAKVYYPNFSDTKPFVYAGPFVGRNLFVGTDEIHKVAEFDFGARANLKEEIKKWESGVAVGAGIAQILRDGIFFLDVRYTLGLTKVFENETFAQVYSGTIAAQVGYGYGHR